MRKETKLYFTSIDDNFCQELKSFSKEELEELNYNLVEAIPDNNNPDYVWCTHYGEVGEKSECTKRICPGYKSKSGLGRCQHKGNLFQHGDLVNVKSEFEQL